MVYFDDRWFLFVNGRWHYTMVICAFTHDLPLKVLHALNPSAETCGNCGTKSAELIYNIIITRRRWASGGKIRIAARRARMRFVPVMKLRHQHAVDAQV